MKREGKGKGRSYLFLFAEREKWDNGALAERKGGGGVPGYEKEKRKGGPG